MTEKLYVGHDIEGVFTTTEGKAVSAPNVFGYTKNQPLRTHCGNLFADNANFEVNVPPASSAEEFVGHMRAILKMTQQVVGDGFKLTFPSALQYPASQLENDYCKEFGCEPDYDAYRMAVNVVPAGAANATLRTCGGHVHTSGYNFLLEMPGKIAMIKAMDATLAIPFVILDDEPQSVLRRNLYGKAGCHRPKSYGVEHRTLSNAWVRSPDLTSFVFKGTEFAAKLVQDGVLAKLPTDELPNIINNGDKVGAVSWMKKIADFYPEYATEYEKVKDLRSTVTKYQQVRQSWGF